MLNTLHLKNIDVFQVMLLQLHVQIFTIGQQ